MVIITMPARAPILSKSTSLISPLLPGIKTWWISSLIAYTRHMPKAIKNTWTLLESGLNLSMLVRALTVKLPRTR